ncbi:MAG: hypothetical protein WED33_10715 [Bacteroidia bacterium]
MRRLILALLMLLPVWASAQVVAPRDTIKPRKDSIRVDTSIYWSDSLFNLPRQKVLKDGAVIRPPKKRKPIRRFRVRYSDRIQYSVLFDWPLTANAGVPTTLALQKQLTTWEDSILPIRWRGDTTRSERTWSAMYRFAKIWLLDAPIESMLMAAEQDFFGSMARIREYNLDGTSYSLKAPYPIPFWKPQGSITYDRPLVESEASRQQLAQISGAALDAGNIASEQLSLRWMQRKSLFYREALHLLRIQMAGIAGVISASSNPQAGTTAVEDWLYYTNRQFGHISDYKYDASRLRRDYALATFTNPNLYTSLYSVFYSYMIQGKDSMATPAIKFGYGYYVLPWMRFGFTPFGPEWIPSVTVTHHRQMIQLYGRIGTDNFSQSYGGGIKVFNLYRNTKVNLNAHATVWKQRYFFRNWVNQSVEPISWGGAAAVSGNILLTKSWKHPMSLAFDVGYKTRGYMEGEVWDASPILRAGLSFALDRDYEEDDTVPSYFVPEKKSKKKGKSKKRRRRR